jgi:hypothetical protein
MISTTHLETLCKYPETSWMTTPSIRWRDLCDSLQKYDSPLDRVVLPKERKWEIVSALQKSIRRGDRSTAHQVLSAAIGLDDEYAYIWRRICVTTCEDIGPADGVLVSFVIACANVFPPRTLAAGNHSVWSFLVDQMCRLSTRSRIYCSFGIIDPVTATQQREKTTPQDELIVSTLSANRNELRQATTPWRIWQKKSDWRTEGLLRYAGLVLVQREMEKRRSPLG